MEIDAETEKEKKNKHNKVITYTVISIFTLLVIYFGITAYFKTHFYLGSEINHVNVSGKTVEEVNKEMASQIKSYKLNLKERNGKSEQIKADDINLKFNSNDEFKKLKDEQGSHKWILGSLTKDSKMTAGISYDDKLLKEKIDNLSCMDSKNIIEPKNPSFKYTSNGYVVMNEVNGNKLNKDLLYNNIVKAVLQGETTLDLETANCYVKPMYTTASKKTTEIKNTLNKYVSSKITYTFGDKKEYIDGSKINNWLTVNGDFEVAFDEDKIKKYLHELSNTHDTIGKTRSFVTSLGKTISIGGGDYGWDINTSKETQNLIASIKQGGIVKKEPEYLQTAASHSANDIGDTYVEIDMSDQHLWFYKKGSLVTQGDVVTGNVSINHSTPAGIYRLKYKERNATLKGEGYSSPVNFWMPFNGGIGIHDASWRNAFGGSIYLTSGSHGCVNSPYYLAKAVFDNIDPGTPVVCYY
ncbi:peptidoglycan binding domain-containing protein [Clostridium sp. JN-1]|uniref:L,D-transpeptidase family protein n=1 Tax=Clostridium sp. JN-1 TaxID=2483110 RepID=UPI000F0BA896|nr:peptidoglycan binding domain-containing protein [Clostridium sp. JN-1]